MPTQDPQAAVEAKFSNRVHPVTRVWKAFFFSLDGIGAALKHEAAFRQEMILTAILLPLVILLPVGWLGKVLLAGSILLVLIVELLNSAIEWVVDYVSVERHPLAKRAKDMGSGAVLISIFNSILIWTLVLWENRESIIDWWHA